MSNNTTRPINFARLSELIPFDCLSERYLQELAESFTLHEFPKGKLIFKRDDNNDPCYFLLEGGVDLINADFEIQHLPADDDENYQALDNYPVHRHNCVTTMPSTLVSLTREQLQLIDQWVQQAEQQDIDEDEMPEEVDWMDMMLASDVFSKIPPASIQQLFSRFEEREVHLGTHVIEEGSEGDTFFVIKRGRALVSRGEGKHRQPLAALKAGDYFGQDALLGDTIRNASVTMTSDGVLVALGRDDFKSLLQETVLETIQEEDLATLEEESDTGLVIIDVRSPDEWKHDRLPGSKNIPLETLRNRVGELESAFTYIITCDDGRRARQGAYICSEAGLHALVLERTPPETREPASTEEDNAASNTPGD